MESNMFQKELKIQSCQVRGCLQSTYNFIHAFSDDMTISNLPKDINHSFIVLEISYFIFLLCHYCILEKDNLLKTCLGGTRFHHFWQIFHRKNKPAFSLLTVSTYARMTHHCTSQSVGIVIALRLHVLVFMMRMRQWGRQ